jgi:DNA adenine methylase
MSLPFTRLRVVPEQPAGVRPLLKWAGGKRWFVGDYGNDMFDLVSRRGGRYIEPFVGGGAMALHLGIKGMVLGDVEEDLILTYMTVRDSPGDLSTMLGLIGDQLDGAAYYRIRASKCRNEIETAARFIYLNKLCFNGLYRKNKSGEFNVPYCKEERSLPPPEHIAEVSRALAGAELHVSDFAKLIEIAGRGDVIYADPPYHKTFSSYSAGGFSDNDHERLAEALYAARRRGAEFFCHNSDTEKTRNWYGDWAEIVPVYERRAINSKGDGRGAVGCVLIAGVDDD